MTDDARLLGRLAHDVGKYVARTARNLPAGPAPEVLVQMLARDLYALEEGRRASEVLEARLAEGPAVADPRVQRARELLAEADRLEEAVRAAEPEAVARAGALAVEVADLLRQAALEARGAGT